jgi:hypothetical protein
MNQEVKDVCERIERDYRSRIGLTCWSTGTELMVEVLLGGSVGRLWQTSVPYARRHGWFRRVEPIQSLSDAERELRRQIDAWLAASPQDQQ